jgi:hypothetical protein
MQGYLILLCIKLRGLRTTKPGYQRLELVPKVMPEQAAVVRMKPVE